MSRTGHHATEPLRSDPELVLDSFATGVAATKDTVFLSSGSILCALHRGTDRIWSADLGDHVESVTMVDGTVYVPAAAGTANSVHALDASTGEEIWSWEQPPPGNDDTAIFTAIPLVADGLVFVNASEGLYALDAIDGTAVWQNEFASTPATPGLSAYGNRTVFSFGEHGLYALEAATGEILWLVEDLTTPRVGFGPTNVPVYGADAVYFTALDGLHAFDVDDGEELWVHRASDVSAPPVLAGDTLYATGSHAVALDPRTGAERWRVPAPDQASFSAFPAVAGDVLFTATDEELVAIDARNGDEIWRLDLIVDRQVLAASPGATLPPTTAVDIELDSAIIVPHERHLYVIAENPDADPQGAGLYVLAEPGAD